MTLLRFFIALFCASALPGIATKTAFASEIAIGLAGVEESDDRYRPASAFQLGIGEKFMGRLYTYGRTLGPFTERTILSGLNYRFLTFGKNTFGHVGGSILMEETRYEPDGDGDVEEDDETKRQWNLGTSFGLTYRVPFDTFYLAFNWDAHLYLAGSAGLFLATGRKHLLGIVTGVQW